LAKKQGATTGRKIMKVGKKASIRTKNVTHSGTGTKSGIASSQKEVPDVPKGTAIKRGGADR